MNPSKERIIVSASENRSESIPVHDKFSTSLCTQVQVDDFDTSAPVEIQVLRDETNCRVRCKEFAPLFLFIVLTLIGVVCGVLGILLLANVFNIEPYNTMHSFFGLVMVIIGTALATVCIGCIMTFYTNNRGKCCKKKRRSNAPTVTVSASEPKRTMEPFDAIL